MGLIEVSWDGGIDLHKRSEFGGFFGIAKLGRTRVWV